MRGNLCSSGGFCRKLLPQLLLGKLDLLVCGMVIADGIM